MGPSEDEILRALGTTLSGVAGGVIVVDAFSNIVAVSGMDGARAGLPASIGRPFAEQLAGRDIALPDGRPLQLPQTALARALRGETVVDHVIAVRRSDGTVIYLSSTAGPVRNPTGRVIGAFAIFHDVTERQQAAEERERLAAIVDFSEDAIVGATLEGVIFSWNAAAQRLFGYSAPEVVGKPISILAPPGCAPGQVEAFAKIGQGIDIPQFDTVRLAKDGRPIDVSLRLSPLKDASGRPCGVSAIIREAMERIRAKKELAWQAGVNAAVADLASALISIASIDDVSAVVLDHAKQLTGSAFGFVGYIDPQTGYMNNTTLTRDIWDVCQVEGKDFVFKEFKGLWGWVLHRGRSVLTNDPAGDERSTGTPPGHIPIRRFLSAPAVVGDTVVGQIALANSGRDYDERDLALIERLAALYALAIQRMRVENQGEEFLMLAAHELRTPLTTLKGYTQLLLKRGDGEAEVPKVYRALSTQSRRIDRLVQAMLDVSQMQSGHMILQHSVWDMCELAQETIALFEQEAPGHRFIPLWEGPVGVEADRGHVRTALFNLLDNAVKYSPNGGPVEVSIRADDREVTVSVRDHGIGIPAEKRERLFQAFYQVAPMVRPTTGMGLGLYLCAQIVRRHGGRIWVESEVGKGSTFTFSLPRKKPAGV
ncbi:MAG: sensor histidine kinase [Chloroflexota bacterium]